MQIPFITGEVLEVPDASFNINSLQAVSPRQIRFALTRLGLRQGVEQAISQANQDLKDWWEYSSEFERNNPQVEVMAAALGVSADQVDALWVLASVL